MKKTSTTLQTKHISIEIHSSGGGYFLFSHSLYFSTFSLLTRRGRAIKKKKKTRLIQPKESNRFCSLFFSSRSLVLVSYFWMHVVWAIQRRHRVHDVLCFLFSHWMFHRAQILSYSVIIVATCMHYSSVSQSKRQYFGWLYVSVYCEQRAFNPLFFTSLRRVVHLVSFAMQKKQQPKK